MAVNSGSRTHTRTHKQWHTDTLAAILASVL